MKLKTFIFVISFIFVFVSLSASGSRDNPGYVTIDSCSFDGKSFSVNGRYKDADGVVRISVKVDGREICSSNSCEGCYLYSCHSTIYEEEESSCTIEVTITDSKGNNSSLSRTCYSNSKYRQS